MILFELVGNEGHPEYQALEVSNGVRQYDFLRSIVVASLKMERPFLSHVIIKALNFHAITCLHTNAGEYRPCPVHVGTHNPPDHYRVPSLMEDFVNEVNFRLSTMDPVVLSAYVLWKLNYIHPFINGNGRTARAAAYFILCVRAGGWLPGATILPELLKVRERAAYVSALRHADESLSTGTLDLGPLHQLITTLLNEQLSAQQEAVPA